jgi:hypothetical protein
VENLGPLKKDHRRHQRIPYLGAVRISWEDERGVARYAKAKCLDVSEEGLRIEVEDPIPVRSTISLREERIKVGGSATVRYTAWHGVKHVLGLNLSETLEKNSLNLAELYSHLDRARA